MEKFDLGHELFGSWKIAFLLQTTGLHLLKETTTEKRQLMVQRF